MTKSQFRLLSSKCFLPLFATQAFGALNDNLFKNALVVLIIYRIADAEGFNGQILVTIAAGIFILPFFLFSAMAGQIADKFEKSAIIRWVKAAEIIIMLLAIVGFWFGNVYFLITVLFLMGTQSSFFGPVKYSILPDHLQKDELISGNALIEAGTFLAILLGTIAGGLLILRDQGTLIISVSVITLAVIGFVTSTQIPKAQPPSPLLKINFNFLSETWRLMRLSAQNRIVYVSILGISWFWLVGATFLTQIPAFTKVILLADETVVTLFLTLFSVGIGIGSLLCNWLLKGEVTAKYVPFGAIGMTIFIIDLYFASTASPQMSGALIDYNTFLMESNNLRIVVDLLGMATCCGIFIVPLYAILQTRSDEAYRSRMIAANNIMNALFMVVGSLAATMMLAAKLSVPDVFLSLAIVNVIVAICARRLL